MTVNDIDTFEQYIGPGKAKTPCKNSHNNNLQKNRIYTTPLYFTSNDMLEYEIVISIGKK